MQLQLNANIFILFYYEMTDMVKSKQEHSDSANSDKAVALSPCGD